MRNRDKRTLNLPLNLLEPIESNPLFGTLIDSAVLPKFFEYIISLREYLIFLNEDINAKQDHNKTHLVQGRIFFSNYGINLGNKDIELVNDQNKTIHIRELLDSEKHIASCLNEYNKCAGGHRQRMEQIEKTIFLLLNNEIFHQEFTLVYPELIHRWNNMWMDSNLHARDIQTSKNYIIKGIAFYLASSIFDIATNRDVKQKQIKLITITDFTTSKNEIFPLCIKFNQKCGIIRLLQPSGIGFALYSIRLTSFFLATTEEEFEFYKKQSHSRYIFYKNALFYGRDANNFSGNLLEGNPLEHSQFFPNSILQLSNEEIQKIYAIAGHIPDIILHKINKDLILSNINFYQEIKKLFDRSNFTEELTLTPLEYQSIYFLFAGCGFLRTNNPIVEMHSFPSSLYLRTADKLYYYHKWENYLQELCDDNELVNIIDKEFPTNVNQLRSDQDIKIGSIVKKHPSIPMGEIKPVNIILTEVSSSFESSPRRSDNSISPDVKRRFFDRKHSPRSPSSLSSDSRPPSPHLTVSQSESPRGISPQKGSPRSRSSSISPPPPGNTLSPEVHSPLMFDLKKSPRENRKRKLSSEDRKFTVTNITPKAEKKQVELKIDTETPEKNPNEKNKRFSKTL